jgi:signal transduction histidine kinase
MAPSADAPRSPNRAVRERRRIAGLLVTAVTLLNVAILCWIAFVVGVDSVPLVVAGVLVAVTAPVIVGRELGGRLARVAMITWVGAALLASGLASSLAPEQVAPWSALAVGGVSGTAMFVFSGRIAHAVVATGGLTILVGSLSLGIPDSVVWAGCAVLPGVFVRLEGRVDGLAATEHRATIGALERRRRAADALHDVAATMGAATSIEEVVPSLLGTVSSALDAGLGALLRIRRSNGLLELESPLIVNGNRVDVPEEVAIRLDSAGVLATALRSPRPVVLDLTTVRASRLSILADLGVESALLGPLWLEGEVTGLLVIGDPREGSFDAGDVEEMAMLAGPTALVLAQVERHEQSAEVARRLQELADMKTDFVSMVSHELRTPLTSVMGALDTVGHPDLDHSDPTMQALIQGARRQARRLKSLIEDLLTLSRVDRTSESQQLERVKTDEIITESVGLVSSGTVSILPGAEGLVALANRDQLTQVLTNLIENALKYGDGSPVEVVGALNGEDIEIRVVDHGPGISDADKARVFERFVRLERSRDIGGTGLGLAIVQLLAERMSGSVSVEDTPGGGATFVVTLAAPDLFHTAA